MATSVSWRSPERWRELAWKFTGAGFVVWWCADLAAKARLNYSAYEFRAGAWLAAVLERLPKRDAVGGNFLGSLKYRMPWMFWLALAVSLWSFSFWWDRDCGRPDDARRFYAWTYVSTAIDAGINHLAGSEKMQGPYQVATGFADGHFVLQALSIHPEEFHGWLKERIFHGGLWNYFRPWLAHVGLTFLGLLPVGLWCDWRRRISAQNGITRRGSRLVSAREFDRHLMGRGLLKKVEGLRIRVSANGETIRIPAQLLSMHVASNGATGNGKTTLIRQMLARAEADGDIAVVLDPKGELAGEYYSAKRGDWIIDPSKEDCPYWALEDEAADEQEGLSIGKAFFPGGPGEQPFFIEWGQSIIGFLVSRYSSFQIATARYPERATTANLAFWLSRPDTELKKRVKGTDFAVAAKEGAKDQQAGVQGTIARMARALRSLPTIGRAFSVREWASVRNAGGQPGWIFFTAGGITEEATKPVSTAIIDLIILRLRAKPKGDARPLKVWIFLDEVATSLEKIAELEVAMTNLRAYGVTVVLGLHDDAQLEKRYGREGARTILGQPRVQTFFQTGEAASSKRCSETIGTQEVWRASENFSAHALFGKRGRSFTWDIREMPVVSASEIQKLQPLEGYLLSGGRVCRIYLSYRLPARMQTFAERLVPGMEVEEAEPEAKDPKPATANDIAEALITKIIQGQMKMQQAKETLVEAEQTPPVAAANGQYYLTGVAPVDDPRPAPAKAKPIQRRVAGRRSK